jgi:hypothetical protein
MEYLSDGVTRVSQTFTIAFIESYFERFSFQVQGEELILKSVLGFGCAGDCSVRVAARQLVAGKC